ncbi:5'-methylthioadenosine/S-adenosylhomocysteine nucleosidase family protein [Mycobacteroides abscessus]|uniref:5'-methylthioadenosine/S-adenosylhomocysteine nucleosidase family protein n=1 Tax=Mycobacteroides abscessus TaxID=36809 RepID=UPI0013F3C394|nr:hypothetical protein [Mycobacteroides abscessus]
MASAEEFLHSRRQLFGFDRRRFPAYFRKYSKSEQADLFTPTIVKASGSTEFLAEYLLDRDALVPHIHAGAQAAYDVTASVVAEALEKRDDRAIIYALFRDQAEQVGDLSPYVSGGIRRSISAAYGLNMVRSMGGTILTGLEKFSYYDKVLADGALALPAAPLLALIQFSSKNLLSRISAGDLSAWRQAVEFLIGPNGDLPALRLWEAYEQIADTSQYSDFGAREVLCSEVRRACRIIPQRSDWRTNILALADALQRKNKKSDEKKGRRMRILITYANEREYQGILDSMEIDPGSIGEPIFGDAVAYDRLPPRNGVELFLVQTETGSVGAGSSQATIHDAIDKIRPDLVAAIGVGFGLIDGDDIGGTVLIATHMREYERVRVGTNKDGGLNLRERGEYRKVDPIELQRLRMVARRSGVKYEVGEIVSGEKLVDWDPLRKLLKKRFPDAVGGDMELAGIVAACSRKHVTWLFLKAISDKGDGSKKTESTAVSPDSGESEILDDDERQRRAARKAMDIFGKYIAHLPKLALD